MRFIAPVVSGSGRGKPLGFPTINLEVQSIPEDIEGGIYAGWVNLSGKQLMAAIHYGERPVFQDSLSFEAYVIDETLESVPETIEIELVERLRNVEDFPSPEALREQIAMDVVQARAILQARAQGS